MGPRRAKVDAELTIAATTTTGRRVTRGSTVAPSRINTIHPVVSSASKSRSRNGNETIEDDGGRQSRQSRSRITPSSIKRITAVRSGTIGGRISVPSTSPKLTVPQLAAVRSSTRKSTTTTLNKLKVTKLTQSAGKMPTSNGILTPRKRSRIEKPKSDSEPVAPRKTRKTGGKPNQVTIKSVRKKTSPVMKVRAVTPPVAGKKRKTESAELPPTFSKKIKRSGKGALSPKPNVTEFVLDPTFEQNLAIPFISPSFQSKLLIRAVLLNDMKLLKKLTQDKKSISSYCVPRSLRIDRHALSYAIEKGNIAAIKILLPDPSPQNLAPTTTWLIQDETTGRGSRYQFGHALRNVTVGRGGKEGNAALLKDRNTVDVIPAVEPLNGTYWSEALEYGLPYSTIEKMKGLFKNEDILFTSQIINTIVSAIRKGHCILGAQLIQIALTKAGWGFNNLHMEVLTKSKKDPLTPFKFQSVGKKAVGNASITPLHCAAINPDPYCLSTLLNMSPLYTILDANNWTIVHYAAACTGTGPLEFIISRGVSTNQINKSGDTPAHIAAEIGRSQNLELILKAEGQSPVGSANDNDEEDASSKSSKASKKIPQDAFSVLRLNKKGMTPLHFACASGNLEAVKVLVASPLVDKDRPTPAQFDKLTPLMLAAGHGHLELVKHLISIGAKLQVKDRRGNIALTHAVINGHAHIVSYLLRLGDNHLAKDSSGNTLIHYACAYGWNFNLQLLMEAGCCPNETNLWKLTPLAIAFCKGHIGLVEILLKQPGVNIDAPIDNKGLTLLLQTVSSKPSADVITRIKYLIEEQKADCNVTDFEKNNALHYLVESEHRELQKLKQLKTRGWGGNNDEEPTLEYTLEALNFIVKNGGNLEARNSAQDTPISLAANYGCFQLVRKLVELGGVLPAEPNMAGNTLLHLLIEHLTEDDENVSEFYNNASKDAESLNAMKVMCGTYNNRGRTPLLQTLNHYQTLDSPTKVKKVVEYILFLAIKLDSNVNATIREVDGTEFSGNSVLHLAAGVNYADEVLNIILTKKPNLDPINSSGRTPLTLAILKHNHTATRVLIENGADVNFISPSDGDKNMLLLEVSERTDTFSLVPLFVRQGAAVKGIVDKKTGNSILHFVAKNPTAVGAVEAIKSLARAGIAMNCENKYRRTSLHLAVTSRGGHTDITYDVEDALIENGANLSLRDIQGRLPLHYAFLKIGKGKGRTANSFMDPIELVTLLTSAMKDSNSAADIVAADQHGQTPLHLAAVRGATISASHLLAESSKLQDLLNAKDISGNTPLALSVLNNHEGCSLMLLQAGSDFVLDLNSGISKALGEDSTSVSGSLIWKPVKYEAKRRDVENSTNANYSILQEIVRKDWQGLLYLMLEKLKATGSGVTPGIEAALKTRRFKLAAKLIDRVKAIEQLITKKQSLLHTLAQHASSGSDNEIQSVILETLIRKNADINAQDAQQSTPLIHAAIKWNSHLCAEFTKLMNIRQIPNLKPDFAGRTPFSALFWNPIPQDVEFPLELKAWAESLLFGGGEGNVRCKYPIRISPFPGIRYICEESSDPNCFMSSITFQYSPLIASVIYGNKKIVKWLLSLQGKFDINFPDSCGRTALMHAVRLNDIQMVKLLLNPTTYDYEKDKRPWSESDTGSTPATATKVPKVTSGVNLNAVDKDGWSIIHHLVTPFDASNSIVYSRADTILKLLAEAGAKLDIKNQSRFCETPFEMALRHQKFTIADALAKRLGSRASDILAIKTGRVAEYELQPPFVDGIPAIPLTMAQKDAGEMLQKLKEKLVVDEDGDLVEADSLSNFTSENSIVVIDDARQVPFDCLLTQVDLAYGAFGLYNFYKMQLIKQTKGPELVILFTRWGRMGDTGQYQKTPFPTEAEGISEFKKIFRAKSGNSWDELATTPFTPLPKKYKLVNVDRNKLNKPNPKFSETVKINFRDLEVASKALPTQLPQEIFQLVWKLALEHRSKPLDSYSNVKGTLAFGQIEYATLQKAEGILDQIDKLLAEEPLNKTKSTTVTSTLGESVLALSEAYFTLIPLHGYAFEKISPFTQLQELRKHQQLVRNFLHNEFAFQLLLAAQLNQERMNPLDYLYATLATKLETLDESSEEAQLLLEYIYNTSTHPNRPIVEKIYRVQIPGADEHLGKLGIGNRHLLWHGTHTCNLLSILNRGLQIAPLGYTFNGSLFGKGIYFADMFEKSIKYTNTVEPDQPKFALVCEVALGRAQDIQTGYWVSQREEILKRGFHSVKTSNSRYVPQPGADVFWKGRRIPLGRASENVLADPDARHGLDYNEYIIFKPEQANIKYLVQFHGSFPNIQMNNLFM